MFGQFKPSPDYPWLVPIRWVNKNELLDVIFAEEHPEWRLPVAEKPDEDEEC